MGVCFESFFISESVEPKVFWVAFIGQALCQPENRYWGLRCGRMLTAASAKQTEQSGVAHQRNHSRAGPERQPYPNHATKSKATVERSGASQSEAAVCHTPPLQQPLAHRRRKDWNALGSLLNFSLKHFWRRS